MLVTGNLKYYKNKFFNSIDFICEKILTIANFYVQIWEEQYNCDRIKVVFTSQRKGLDVIYTNGRINGIFF